MMVGPGEESVSGIVWFAALYWVPIFLWEYLSFYFLMTFLKYCGKIHTTQSSLAWALYHVNSMMLSTFIPLWNHHHHRLQEVLILQNADPLHPLNTNSSFPFPKPLVTTSLLSASVFTTLGTGFTVLFLLGSHMSPDFAYAVICQWTLGLLPL